MSLEILFSSQRLPPFLLRLVDVDEHERGTRFGSEI